MWNEPAPDELARLPALYGSETVPPEKKIVHLHFFLGASDWYAVEYCPDRRLFFGFVILNGDLPNAEWGYFALDELRAIRVLGIEIDRDLHWRPRPARDVERIRAARGIEAPHDA